MQGRSFWRFGQMLALVAVLALGAATLAGAFSPSATPTAMASPAAQNDNDDGDDGGNDNTETEIEGQVLPVQCPTVRGSDPGVAAVCIDLPEGAFIPAVNPGSDPPDMYVHNIDGAVRVIVRDRNLLDQYQFQPGDYVRLGGQRITEFLFEANDVESVDRAGGGDDNDND